MTSAVEALREAKGSTPAEKRVAAALDVIRRLGGFDGAHHKQHALDQLVRVLTGCESEQKTALDYRRQPYTYEGLNESDEYKAWVKSYEDGEDGPQTYLWDIGVPP